VPSAAATCRGARGTLLRVSVLDCRGEGVDHLRAALRVSPEPDLRGLSSRELKLLGFLAAGWPDERIAAVMRRTPAEVVDDVRRSMELLGAPSRDGLAVRASREGLFLPPREAGA
jgi:DNA-binding NarL/FixJ family response regulator